MLIFFKCTKTVNTDLFIWSKHFEILVKIMVASSAFTHRFSFLILVMLSLCERRSRGCAWSVIECELTSCLRSFLMRFPVRRGSQGSLLSRAPPAPPFCVHVLYVVLSWCLFSFFRVVGLHRLGVSTCLIVTPLPSSCLPPLTRCRQECKL